MYGLMAMSSDGEITVVVLPNPLNPKEIQLRITISGEALPPIPLPVEDLKLILRSVEHGTPKAN